jgi:hypothetical protein
MVSTLGDRFGYQTSYQSCDANSAFGTPLGGRRTVPIRVPSPSALGLPNLMTRMAMFALSCSVYELIQKCYPCPQNNLLPMCPFGQLVFSLLVRCQWLGDPFIPYCHDKVLPHHISHFNSVPIAIPLWRQHLCVGNIWRSRCGASAYGKGHYMWSRKAGTIDFARSAGLTCYAARCTF